jgi:hypothetical protein
MKRYIIPSITIDPTFAMNILAGTLQKHDDYSDADDLSNQGLYDGMEDAYPPKDKGLWEE